MPRKAEVRRWTVCVLASASLALNACRPVAPPVAPSQAAFPSIDRVLAGLLPPVQVKGEAAERWTLAERMAHYKAPGVSIAVVDGGRLAWARGFGVKEAGGSDVVTPTTMFQAASISKVLAALGTMRLVQEGRLSLDADVNESLKSWKVPENEHTQKEKVTLRRIMSHTAGLTVHGFAGFAPDEPLPVVTQILDGVKPAKNRPVRVEAVPGSRPQYSGGGTTVMQLLVSEVTGKPYAQFLAETVLAPLGMTHSTFEQPLPERWMRDAAAAHDETGTVLPGKWHYHPMMAAAGLWTTPTDVARLITNVQQTLAGRSERVVNQRSIREMLTVVTPPHGLGFYLEGSGRDLRFSHTGSNDGYRAIFVGYAERGLGAVVMMNSPHQELLFEIVRAIAAEYRWPDSYMNEIETVRLTPEQIARLVGDYRLTADPSVIIHLTQEGDNLYLQIDGEEKDRLLPTSEDTLFAASSDLDLRAIFEGPGPARKIVARGTYTAERVP